MSASKIYKDEDDLAENERDIVVGVQRFDSDINFQNDLGRSEGSTTSKPKGMINDGVLNNNHEVHNYLSNFPINIEAPQNESTTLLQVESQQNALSHSKYLDSRSDANSLDVTSSQIPVLTNEYDISCEIGNDSARRYEDKS